MIESNINTKAPKQLIEMVTSEKFLDAIDAIEQKLGLHIDQSGELYVIVSEIIKGNLKSSDFIKSVRERLEVDEKRANEIAEETNRMVFSVFKGNLQTQTIQDDKAVSSLEKVGRFNIEKEVAAPSPADVTAADRDTILAGVEHPQNHVVEPPANLPVVEVHEEPLVDMLLTKPAGQTEQRTVPAAPPIKTLEPKMKPDSGGPDPYREPIQ